MLKPLLRMLIVCVVGFPLVHGLFFGLAVQFQGNTTPLQTSPALPPHEWVAYVDHVASVWHGTALFPGSTERLVDVLLQQWGRSLGLYVLAATFATMAGCWLAYTLVTQQRQLPWWMSGADALQSLFVASLAVATLYFILLSTPWQAPLPLHGFGWDEHLILPLTALCLRPFLVITQRITTLLEQAWHAPHVVVAQARGLSRGDIITRHLLPAQQSAIGVVIAGQLRQLIADLIIVEMIFQWGGIGETLVRAIVSPVLTNQQQVAVYHDAGIIASIASGLFLWFLVIEMLRYVWQPRYVYQSGDFA
jgi:ABC-type dipeptide/oligopeptide/nickel transport system permease component